MLNINFGESQTGVKALKAATQHSADNEEVGSDRRTLASSPRHPPTPRAGRHPSLTPAARVQAAQLQEQAAAPLHSALPPSRVEVNSYTSTSQYKPQKTAKSTRTNLKVHESLGHST